MHSTTLRADLLLLLTAAIWGFAFVAQRLGMEYMGPFYFNALRFALGALALVPLLCIIPRRQLSSKNFSLKSTFFGGLLAGVVLFSGSTLQQIGIIYTTEGIND
jgi:drug/metabolite transporter (DMT)-like permease